jgi:hypothetical protein
VARRIPTNRVALPTDAGAYRHGRRDESDRGRLAQNFSMAARKKSLRASSSGVTKKFSKLDWRLMRKFLTTLASLSLTGWTLARRQRIVTLQNAAGLP